MADNLTSDGIRFAALPGDDGGYDRTAVDSFLLRVARSLESLEMRVSVAEDRAVGLERDLAAAKTDIAGLMTHGRPTVESMRPPLADVSNVRPSDVKLDQLERAARRKLADADSRLESAEREARAILETARREASSLVESAGTGISDEDELARIRLVTAALRRLFDIKRDRARALLLAVSRHLVAQGIDGGDELEDLGVLFGIPSLRELVTVDLTHDEELAARRID